jgi:hypothetical protein
MIPDRYLFHRDLTAKYKNTPRRPVEMFDETGVR